LVSLLVSRRNQNKTFALAALTPQSSAVVMVAGQQNLLPVYKTWKKPVRGKHRADSTGEKVSLASNWDGW
jgi:hypothetical protein